MNRSKKTALAVAVALVLAGALLFGVAFCLGARPQQVWTGGLLNFPFLGDLRDLNGYRQWNNEYKDDGVYTVGADAVDRVEIRWASGAVRVDAYDGEAIRLCESADAALPAEHALRYGVENRVLYIQFCAPASAGNLPAKRLDVQLPRALAERLQGLSCDTASASLAASDLTAEEFRFESASGELQASGIAASNARIGSTSGALRFDGSYQRMQAASTSGDVAVCSRAGAQTTAVETTSGAISLCGDCGDLRASSISGRIQASDAVAAQTLEASTTSGDIHLFGLVQQRATLRSTSGALRLDASACPQALHASSTSGDVTLVLPPDSGFTLNFATTSGDLQCDFGVLLQGERLISGDGTAAFDVQTTSANLRIRSS